MALIENGDQSLYCPDNAWNYFPGLSFPPK